MRLRESFAKGLLIALGVALIPVTAASAQKITPGSTCKVLNQKVVYENKTYTCVKSGKKLAWNKGLVVDRTASTPKPKTQPTQVVATFAPVEVKLNSVKIENDLEITYFSPINWGGLVANDQAVMKFPVTLKSNVDANIVRVLVQHSEGVQHIVVSGNWDWEYVKAGESKTLDLNISWGAIKSRRELGYAGGYTFKVFLNYKDKTKRETSFQVPIEFVLPTAR